MSREFFLGEIFAGFALDSLNFLSELFLEAGTAYTGLERPRLFERGITCAVAREELTVLLLLPASKSSKDISLTDFLLN